MFLVLQNGVKLRLYPVGKMQKLLRGQKVQKKLWGQSKGSKGPKGEKGKRR